MEPYIADLIPDTPAQHTGSKDLTTPARSREELFARFTELVIQTDNPFADIAVDPEMKKELLEMTIEDKIAMILVVQALSGDKESIRMVLDNTRGKQSHGNSTNVAVQINANGLLAEAMERLDRRSTDTLQPYNPESAARGPVLEYEPARRSPDRERTISIDTA